MFGRTTRRGMRRIPKRTPLWSVNQYSVFIKITYATRSKFLNQAVLEAYAEIGPATLVHMYLQARSVRRRIVELCTLHNKGGQVSPVTQEEIRELRNHLISKAHLRVGKHRLTEITDEGASWLLRLKLEEG